MIPRLVVAGVLVLAVACSGGDDLGPSGTGRPASAPVTEAPGVADGGSPSTAPGAPSPSSPTSVAADEAGLAFVAGVAAARVMEANGQRVAAHLGPAGPVAAAFADGVRSVLPDATVLVGSPDGLASAVTVLRDQIARGAGLVSLDLGADTETIALEAGAFKVPLVSWWVDRCGDLAAPWAVSAVDLAPGGVVLCSGDRTAQAAIDAEIASVLAGR